MVGPEPDEHKLAIRVEPGERRCANLSQGLDGITVNFCHPGYRVAGGEDTPEAGGHEEITGLYIGVRGQVGESQ
jgi:hypothetical protein